jgi:hypothetical protein
MEVPPDLLTKDEPMRRAFLLAGSLTLLVLGIACDHYHGVCDCHPIANSATCGFYEQAHANACAASAPVAGPTGIAPTALQPLQVMPKATEALPLPKD